MEEQGRWEEFVAGIEAEPFDDNRLMVFADFLQERGSQDSASRIREHVSEVGPLLVGEAVGETTNERWLFIQRRDAARESRRKLVGSIRLELILRRPADQLPRPPLRSV